MSVAFGFLLQGKSAVTVLIKLILLSVSFIGAETLVLLVFLAFIREER